MLILKSVVDSVTPVLVWFAFGGITSYCLEIFYCADTYDGIAYLSIDCQSRCWTGTHIGFLSAVTLITPAVVALMVKGRVLWQIY
jgi:hypothetical protein